MRRRPTGGFRHTVTQRSGEVFAIAHRGCRPDLRPRIRWHAARMPDRRVPDRYADAVRARRAELRALTALLDGGHRAELRSCLALARVTGSAALAADLAELGRDLRAHVERADRRGRAALPRLVAAATEQLVAAAARRREPVLAAVRALAAERGLLPGPEWPSAARAEPVASSALPPPDPPTGASMLAGLADGAGVWRLVLPLAGLPMLGLPALGGAALLPVAIVAGVAMVAAAVQMRRSAADRARWRLWAGETHIALRTSLGTDLDTWLIALERTVAPELDRRAERLRVVLDAELRNLEPDPVEAAGATR